MKYSSLISSISQNKSGLWNVPDEKKVTLKRNTMGQPLEDSSQRSAEETLALQLWLIKRHCH